LNNSILDPFTGSGTVFVVTNPPFFTSVNYCLLGLDRTVPKGCLKERGLVRYLQRGVFRGIGSLPYEIEPTPQLSRWLISLCSLARIYRTPLPIGQCKYARQFLAS